MDILLLFGPLTSWSPRCAWRLPGRGSLGNLLFIKHAGKSPACWEPLAALIQNLHGPLSCLPSPPEQQDRRGRLNLEEAEFSECQAESHGWPLPCFSSKFLSTRLLLAVPLVGFDSLPLEQVVSSAWEGPCSRNPSLDCCWETPVRLSSLICWTREALPVALLAFPEGLSVVPTPIFS